MTARIPDRVLDEIRRKVDLVDLAARSGVRLAEKGRGDFWGCCPFHKEKTGSFHILRARGRYKCFGCGAGGDPIRFWRETQGLSFADAVADLAQMAGVDMGSYEPSPAGAVSSPPPRPVTDPPPAVPASEKSAADERKTKIDKARATYWNRTLDLAGSAAETYLLEARAIRASVVAGVRALRFLPQCPYWAKPAGNRYFEKIHVGPALAAGMQTADGRFAAVHLTYLEADGSDKLRLWMRPPSRLTGDPGEAFPAKKIHGAAGAAAIRLGAPAADMAVAEGIETALSSPSAGGPVAWAAGSLNNMAGPGLESAYRAPHPHDRRRKLPTEFPDCRLPSFSFPATTETALVIGDGDTKDRFMLDVLLKRACRRFRMQGIDAGYVVTPPGTDLNDVWRQESEGVSGGRGA